MKKESNDKQVKTFLELSKTTADAVSFEKWAFGSIDRPTPVKKLTVSDIVNSSVFVESFGKALLLKKYRDQLVEAYGLDQVETAEADSKLIYEDVVIV
jgi:hypothetical protein